MKCDELKAYTLFTTSSLSGQRVYLTNKVDEAIAELKAEKAQAEDDVAYWKMQYENAKTSVKETEERCEELEKKLHSMCEKARDVSGMTIDKVSELNEAILIKDELLIENGKQIGELKQKLHEAEMRADLAEAAETERKIDYDNLKNNLAESAKKSYLKHFADKEKEHRQTLRALCMLRAECARRKWCELYYEKKRDLCAFKN